MGVKVTIDCPNCAGKVYVLSDLPPMEVTCSTCLAVWIWPSETHPGRQIHVSKVRLAVFGAICLVFLFLIALLGYGVASEEIPLSNLQPGFAIALGVVGTIVLLWGLWLTVGTFEIADKTANRRRVVFIFLGIGLLIYPMLYLKLEHGKHAMDQRKAKVVQMERRHPAEENPLHPKQDDIPEPGFLKKQGGVFFLGEKLEELPLPENGHGVFNFDQKTARSGLEIRPSAGAENLLVKVVKTDDPQVVCTFLILKGQTFKTPIPSGDYRIRLASGATWFGDKHTFGPDGVYSEIAQVIAIRDGINERISLTPDIKGKLLEKRIRASDF